jgi:hypothetical protein
MSKTVKFLLSHVFTALLPLALTVFVALALPARATAALQEPRHALVIGNSRYATAPLPNPVNDARAVAAALQRAGFTVDLKLDATQAQLRRPSAASATS